MFVYAHAIKLFQAVVKLKSRENVIVAEKQKIKGISYA